MKGFWITEVQIQSFFTQTLDEGKSSDSRSGSFVLRKEPQVPA